MERGQGNIATVEHPKQEASPVIKGETKKTSKSRGQIESINGTATWAYMHKLGLTGDQLVQLRQALIPAKVQGKRGTLVRVFAPTSCEARGVTVHDFNSLDEHPDLILYEGYYYGRGDPGEILIEKRTGTGQSLLERELRDGGITDVGMKEEPTMVMKWLGRLGKFLMLGGWILILLVVVGIIIAVFVLTK